LCTCWSGKRPTTHWVQLNSTQLNNRFDRFNSTQFRRREWCCTLLLLLPLPLLLLLLPLPLLLLPLPLLLLPLPLRKLGD